MYLGDALAVIWYFYSNYQKNLSKSCVCFLVENWPDGRYMEYTGPLRRDIGEEFGADYNQRGLWDLLKSLSLIKGNFGSTSVKALY